MTLPWVYTRRSLAEKWGIPPWEVDEAPINEIMLELQISQIEGDVAFQQNAPAGPDRPRAV